jgi:putative ABC transport system substrate-binding protein
MRRREFIMLVGGAAVMWPLMARAQQRTSNVPQIGLLDPGVAHNFEAFLGGMRDLGYVEGQNVSYVRRSAEGRPEVIPQLAADLVRLKVDVIVTTATAPVRAAMQATSTIPIVFGALGDAIGAGAVSSLARPGGNVTGFSFLNTEISGKRLALLSEALPKLRRIAVLWDRSTPRSFVEFTEAAARSLDLQLQLLTVGGPDEFESAFENAMTGTAEALNVLSSVFFDANRVHLVELAARHRLPAMYETTTYVRAGGLMAYGPDLDDLFRRSAATYVDRILKGAKPGDLPVEQPTKFELVVNLKTAGALGLTIPQSILARADEIVE